MGQAEVVGAVVEGGFAVIDKYFWHILWALVAALVLNIFVFVRFVLPKVTKPFLNPHEFQPLTLIEKERLTHNTSWLRFALPHNTTILGLPTGAHIIFKLQGKDGKDVFRPYTPVSDDRQLGFVDFVIKVYPTGKMTPLLEELKVGDTVPMKGPRGQFRYQANKWRAIGMIAGGTGITPMYQVLNAILSNPKDKTRVTLLYGNITVDDIILRAELDKIAMERPDRFEVYYVLNTPPEGWTQGVGFVTPDMIQMKLPVPAEDSLILSCGPTPMCVAIKGYLQTLGYDEAGQFQF